MPIAWERIGYDFTGASGDFFIDAWRPCPGRVYETYAIIEERWVRYPRHMRSE
jgi:hypothetical protein